MPPDGFVIPYSRCPLCGTDSVLWDHAVEEEDTGKTTHHYHCRCGSRWTQEGGGPGIVIRARRGT